MITKYQANLENNHVRGINNYTPPTYTYIGLSTVAIDDSRILPENAEPDASTGYARIRVRNNSETWNDSANGIISNKIKLEFPNEFSSNAGIVGYGIGNDSYTSYLQTAEIHSDTSDHYINATFYLESSNLDRTVHGVISTFAGQNFEFNWGNVQLILFRDYGINSLVNGDEVSY